MLVPLPVSQVQKWEDGGAAGSWTELRVWAVVRQVAVAGRLSRRGAGGGAVGIRVCRAEHSIKNMIRGDINLLFFKKQMNGQYYTCDRVSTSRTYCFFWAPSAAFRSGSAALSWRWTLSSWAEKLALGWGLPWHRQPVWSEFTTEWPCMFKVNC